MIRGSPLWLSKSTSPLHLASEYLNISRKGSQTQWGHSWVLLVAVHGNRLTQGCWNQEGPLQSPFVSLRLENICLWGGGLPCFTHYSWRKPHIVLQLLRKADSGVATCHGLFAQSNSWKQSQREAKVRMVPAPPPAVPPPTLALTLSG